MPLIDLKTDLKSLRYGKDRIYGGSSNQPYITKKIPEGSSSLGVLDNDFLLRGGITAISESGKDVLRIGKMFSDLRSINGLLFTTKQELLSKSAVRTQASNSPLNEGIYTPLNTLAQVGVSAFGLHLNKQGNNPYPGGDGSIITYSEVVKPTQSTSTNRLVAINDYIQKNKGTTNWEFSGIDINVGPNVVSYNGGPGSNLGIGRTNIKYADQRTGKNSLTDLNLNKPGFTDFGYYVVKSVQDGKLKGGIKINTDQPWNSSKYDLPDNNVNTPQYDPKNPLEQEISGSYNVFNGNGVSQKYTNAFPKSKLFGNDFNSDGKPLWNNSVYNSGSSFPDGTNAANFDNGTITYDQSQLNEAIPVSKGGTVKDFRSIIRSSTRGLASKSNIVSGELTNAPSYVDKNIETRVQLGDPGNRKGKSYANYASGSVSLTSKTGKGEPLDKINASAIGADPTKLNDLVTFNIIPIDGDNAMTFRAFLGPISDNYSAEINSQKFVGRGENFYTYGGFDRKISLSWTVAAQSKAELIPMYKKLNYLASNLAPIYNGGFMQGPIVQLTVGGYFHKLPGYITGLNYDLGEESTWEIQIDTEGNPDREVSELAHVIKVSGFTFVPIMRNLPTKGARFIDLWNGQKYL